MDGSREMDGRRSGVTSVFVATLHTTGKVFAIHDKSPTMGHADQFRVRGQGPRVQSTVPNDGTVPFLWQE